MPIYGAFCTGTYSYIWNSGYLFNGQNGYEKASLKYNNGDVSSGFRVLKVRDELRSVCISKTLAASGSGYTINNDNFNSVFDISGYEVVDEAPVFMLANDGYNGLVLYDLTSAAPVESGDAGGLFYAASFILGTVRGGINVKTTGNYCVPPGGGNNAAEDFTYCAVNKFNFAAQATGE